ncbi:hypothetical protein [Paenibacillus sp. FSL H8-0537]|uniref:hypothetical protein n=1 Tax=Paenibacillus sp. FSL H8-0537 TaxID=2921399 RepID=UPI003100F93A
MIAKQEAKIKLLEAGALIKKALHRRGFKKGIPGLVLLTDITYLPYGYSQMAYLSTILDASTGELLAHNLSTTLHLPLATDTIELLIRQRRLKLHPDAFLHSDQGSHLLE